MSILNKSFQLILSIIFFVTFVASVDATTINDFSKKPEYNNIKISPDGKHFAALVNGEEGLSLVFLDSKTFKITYALNPGRKSQPGNYYWVNNERVIIQVLQMRGSFEQPLNYGELYAVNYDGKKGRMLFGYRAVDPTSNSGILVDILKGDRKNVLIQQQRLSKHSDTKSDIVKLNVYNGKTKQLRRSPIAYSRFLIDHNGIPRFVSGTDKNFNTKLFYSNGYGDSWKPFDEGFKGGIQLLAFTPDNESVYVLKSDTGAPRSLFKFNLTTKEQTFIYKSDIADPSEILLSDLNGAYGIRIDEDYPKYVYLDENNNDAKIHKALFSAFKGDKLSITSKTEDGSKIIVHTSSDRNPGTFYLFDTKTMKAKFLFSSASWIKAKEMSAVEPFRIKTADKLVLNGYITLPKGKDKNLPTVVLPHGGPHARDYWRYDSQVQMLTNAGYAVIQVNFRGSTGYGDNFKEAGYEKWGTKIQDDILLATKYAIQQGISDKERICIFGTSFGGYSALQSAIRKPNLFKCAIGYAGVYDLPMLYTEGDVKNNTWSDAFLDKTLGTDVVVQKAQSPVYHVDQLKAPVLLIHGEDDERAPIEHAEKLRSALDKANHPYKWLVKDKEGHGFYKEENVIEANKAILSFLNENIGA